MKINKETKKDIVSLSSSYIDMRHLEDDITVLKNPHKGWFYHYIDNGFGRANYRNCIHEGDHLEWFPGLHNIYLRFDWADIEKEEGVYDWSYIDEIMNEWKKFGYVFSIRVCTYEVSTIRYATPKWLVDMGIDGKFYDTGRDDVDGCFEPVYSDPLFLEKLDNFMAECGRKFDGNPLVDYVEIGTFGAWGEGHNAFGMGRVYDIETVKKHINIHIRNFPNTTVLINDDTISHLRQNDPEAGAEIMEYAMARGVGIRDDSVCVEYYSETFGYDTLETDFYYKYFTPNAPTSLELEHYHLIKPENLGDCFRYLEALKKGKATYSGFHGDPYEWFKRFRWFTEYAANRLGYWYFIDGVDLPECYSGAHTVMKLFVRNEGFAKAYHRYEMKVVAEGENGRFVLNDESPDNRCWNGGGAAHENIMLDFTKVPCGKYTVKIGMFEGETPIKLALKKDILDSSGYYKIADIDVGKLI